MDVKTLDQTTILQTSTDNTTGEAPSDYDHEGAMKFIISTILVYSLLGIVSMLVSRLRKKSNSYHRQLDDDVTHFIKTDKTLRESFHRQTLLYRRNTFVKMMKTADEMEKAEEEMSTDDGGEKDETADDNGPKVTFHLENEVQEKSETLKLVEFPLKAFADSSCQTDDTSP
ncbi:uncharacterized protein LOC125671825 [Ostrea edulis]|uniref:uncharacterized protein LOC125671825 n=1 Tax=Ostrea edulis TaxID=37623 RepID=UPI0024AF215F|nr:uncharacterized protein LOC125671825 [Ostrea edulis]